MEQYDRIWNPRFDKTLKLTSLNDRAGIRGVLLRVARHVQETGMALGRAAYNDLFSEEVLQSL